MSSLNSWVMSLSLEDLGCSITACIYLSGVFWFHYGCAKIQLGWQKFSDAPHKNLIIFIIIHWTHYLFSDWSKVYTCTVNFWNQRLYVISADYTIIMSRPLKVTVIMSSSHTLCCLPSVKKQKHDFHFFHSMYNKTIIRFGFCDIQNNQGLGRGYQPQPSALAENPYLDLDYSRYHKNLIQ